MSRESLLPEYVSCDGPHRFPSSDTSGDLYFDVELHPAGRRSRVKFTPTAIPGAPERDNPSEKGLQDYDLAWAAGFALLNALTTQEQIADPLLISSCQIQQLFHAAHKNSRCFLAARCSNRKCSRTTKLFEFGPPWKPAAPLGIEQLFSVKCKCGLPLVGTAASFHLYHIEPLPPVLQRERSQE